MKGLNKAQLIGNLGRGPEIRHTQSGKKVVNLTVATTDYYDSKEQTEWHNIVCWGKAADVAGQYLTKGKRVYIEGKITTRKWEDRQGQQRSTTEIVCFNLILLSPKEEAPQEPHQPDPGMEPTTDDDLPF